MRMYGEFRARLRFVFETETGGVALAQPSL
jgi:hypothetical protein